MNRPDDGFGEGDQPKRDFPPRKRHATLPGDFPTKKAAAGLVRTRLPLMGDGLVHFDTDPRWVRIAPYPVRVAYEAADDRGRFVVCEHVPDLGARDRDGNTVFVDYVPWSIQRQRPWIAARAATLRRVFADELGASYAVHDERSLHVQPRFSNLKTMWKHKLHGTDTKALMAVRKALAALPATTTIAEVRTAAGLPGMCLVTTGSGGSHSRDLTDIDRAFSALMQLAMDGSVALDLSKPFSGATLVFQDTQKGTGQ